MLKGSKLKVLDVRILRSLIESSCGQQRSFANSIQRSYITFNDFRTKNRWYTKKELVGYSMQDMYTVVADVSNYYKFVPYVKRSHVHTVDSDKSGFKADLIVGFPPLNEAYTSRVTLESPSLVKSECHDGRLFNYLLNEWRFSPGLKDIPNSCVLDFKVSFEFKSLLHSNVANIFFDLICDQMENAFIAEVGRRNGPPSIRSHVLTSQRS
ncbi:coenzyme Q-binding protein COQ10, mitochondrial isoform X1 [Drosophila subobscura]|uniref:coenzyme Q-binding protein COQ10, mitochondrial isoform X1 n=1 Tax=Drosophila subobscura TaxID=7241 RepID=UPI00155AEBE0|nr:coenzyme Q-binding protein COQ10, mitochondrial isoform X1 [Drosophila subobscura]